MSFLLSESKDNYKKRIKLEFLIKFILAIIYYFFIINNRS